jgi:nucleoid DNA-binding protein
VTHSQSPSRKVHMTKSQLIAIVAKKAHLTKRASNDAVEAIFEEITRALKKGEKVVISGFGTFYVNTVNDKQVVPFGDETKRQTIRSHRVINFRVGKPLKKVVW